MIEKGRQRIAELEERWEDVYLVQNQADKLRKAAWGHKEEGK